jgi:hypothetical protein
MQDFSWRPEGERTLSFVALLFPILGIVVGMLIGLAITSGAWYSGQLTRPTERLSAKVDSVLGSGTSAPPSSAEASAEVKEDRPVIILNPAAVQTPASPVATTQASPDHVIPPGQGRVETSIPRPLAPTDAPKNNVFPDYRALRLEMLREAQGPDRQDR